ncbi:MAG: hypothetical protein HOM47_04720 [Euryarchaeota archaeon]|jgi:hypothetical protein|nr:hypothetical protein [Euryarchaeota archaeon]
MTGKTNAIAAVLLALLVAGSSYWVAMDRLAIDSEVHEPEKTPEENHRVELTPDDCTMVQVWRDNDCIDLTPVRNLTYSSNKIMWGIGQQNEYIPSFSGDAPDSWTISSDLPMGIHLSQLGVISGTPVEYDTTQNNYSITASNAIGFSIFEFELILTDIIPSELTYSDSPYIFTYGEVLFNEVPVVLGGEINSFSSYPELPEGMSLSTEGTVSGQALELGMSNHTIFANNSGGSSTTEITILVVDHPVSNLGYTYSPLNCFVNETMFTLQPSMSGGQITEWGIGELPLGLVFTDGEINGIPQAIGTYTFQIFANNSGGTTSTVVQINVVDRPVSEIDYGGDLDLVWNVPYDISPSLSGGVVVEWGINPELPIGLFFDEGRIYGNASELYTKTVHTVWANNTGGSFFITLNLSVSDMTPGNISWQKPVIAIASNQTSHLEVINEGPMIETWEIEPELPIGLVLDEGNITGTPLSRMNWTIFTIWANNTGGSFQTNLKLAVHDLDADSSDLSAGVGVLDYGSSWPSMIVPHGEWSFPIGMDWAGRPLITASHAGQGRMVGFGHESLVSRSTGNESVMSMNAVNWVCHGSSIGVVSSYNNFEDELVAAGYSVTTSIDITSLGNYDCILAQFWNSYGDIGNDAIESFLISGGGVVMGGHAWYWSYSNIDVANNYPGNHFAKTSGMFVSSQNIGTGADLTIPLSDLHRPARALQAVEEHILTGPLLNTEGKEYAGGCIKTIAANIPLDWPGFWPDIRQLVNTTGWIEISPSYTFDLGADGIDDMFLSIQESLMLQLPPTELGIHPSAKDFPGAVPTNASRITRTVSVDGNYSGLPSNFGYSGARSDGRFSTGLYAGPGELVNITIPTSIVATGVNILIGAHSDSLWNKDVISRHPQIVRAYQADNSTFQVANSFGGPIYVRVPAGSNLGDFNVTIEGGIPSPLYVHNQTTMAEWNNTQRNYPGPWAELVSGAFILTVPSNEIRSLNNTDVLMDWWETALQMEHDLSGMSDWPRIERAVFDVQISAGWMHSGYPFMAHLASVQNVVDFDHMSTSGDWGMFHELGHNHQWMPSTLPGTTEATCNLYSVRLMEDLVGVDLGQGHSALQNSSRETRRDNYFNGGSQISQWSVWTALETYLQVKEEFGWEPITFALSEYYSMSNPPSGDSAEFNEWTIRISNATGYNLAPFHEAWGFPLAPETHAALDHLPVWTTDPQRNGIYEYNSIIQNQTESNVSSGTADLEWSIYDNGTNSNITICWGLTDGGQMKSAWANCGLKGTSIVGDMQHSVSSLTSGLTYHWRIMSENSNGETWFSDHTFIAS